MATRPQRPTDNIHRNRWKQDGKVWTYGVVSIIQGPDDSLWRVKDILPADTQRVKGDEDRIWKNVSEAQLHVERHYLTLCVQGNHQPKRIWRKT